jgi:lipopolysaccharide biosynthesis regulator YciM
MIPARSRLPSEVIRRGYSDEEISQIYELGRFFLENGSLRKAEAIMHGLTEIANEFTPAWLGMAFIHLQNKNVEGAANAARQALRLNSQSTEAMLFMVICSLAMADYNAAGTWLGEIREKIDGGIVLDHQLIRLYKAQLARFQMKV